MFNVGGGELLVILLVALIVLGPQRLPEAARTVGRVVGEIRRLSTGFQREIRDAFEDTDRTRPERAPLAAAVDDVDAIPATSTPTDADTPGDAGTPTDADTKTAGSGDAATDADTDTGSTAGAINGTATGGTNGSGGLAPEVGDAIDQVVAATPPAGDRPGGTAEPALDTAHDSAHDTADVPEDGPGDARAAS